MNIRSAIFVSLAVSAWTIGFAASRIESPVRIIAPPEEAKLRDLKQVKHPWTKERSLPVSLADCGLKADAKLVVTSLYLDGGSRMFALKDSTDAYFVFCTSKPQSQAKRDGDPEWNEHFVVGAKHYLEKDGVSVPRGSPAEAFLLKAIAGRISHAP